MKRFRQKGHPHTQKNKDMDLKMIEEENYSKTKSMIESYPFLPCSIKCLAVKKNQIVAPTTRFFSGKMLMLAKLSRKMFVYQLGEIFYFLSNKMKAIYDKYMIEQVFPYSVLTDTDSIRFFFISICKPESNIPDEKFRDVLFEVICENDILHRFDTSHKFWEKFCVRNTSLKKKLGYYAVENIDDPCNITIAVNPKEYFEEFESEKTNRKHNGPRKAALGMEFENYTRRINSVKDIETFGQNLPEKQKQNRFEIKQNEMVLEEIEKSKFVQINDKRYYFSDGIVSLPFSHALLHESNQLKKKKKKKNQKIELYLQEENISS